MDNPPKPCFALFRSIKDLFLGVLRRKPKELNSLGESSNLEEKVIHPIKDLEGNSLKYWSRKKTNNGSSSKLNREH